MEQPFVNDQSNIASIYQQMLNEDMTSGGAFGGDIAGHAGIEATDWFAPGDMRNPYGMGITTRNGALSGRKGKKRKKLKKKITENYQYTGSCVECEDGMEVQEITRQDDFKFPEETYFHDPEMQIDGVLYFKLTGDSLGDALAFWNRDLDVVFKYDPDKDIHYFYGKI